MEPKNYCLVGSPDAVRNRLLTLTRKRLFGPGGGVALYTNLQWYAGMERIEAYRALCEDLTAHLRLSDGELEGLPWSTVNPRHLAYRVATAYVFSGVGPRYLHWYAGSEGRAAPHDLLDMVRDWGSWALDEGAPWGRLYQVVGYAGAAPPQLKNWPVAPGSSLRIPPAGGP